MSQLRAFYVFLAAIAAKVPHSLIVAALAVTIWGPTVLAAITGTPLAADGVYITKAIAFAAAILALAKQLSPGSETGAAIDAAAIKAAAIKAASRGFSALRLVVGIALVGLLGLGTVSVLRTPHRAPIAVMVESPAEELGGCSGVGPVSPNTVQSVLNDEQYACVVDQIINTVLPTGSVQQVATFVQGLCQDLIPQTATQLVVNFINALSARSGDAGLAKFLLAHGAVRR